VEELRATCNQHSGADAVQLSLELEDVSFADDAGVTCLKELQAQGVVLFRVSPFLVELLGNGSSPDESWR
jgi:hypothetical protein